MNLKNYSSKKYILISVLNKEYGARMILGLFFCVRNGFPLKDLDPAGNSGKNKRDEAIEKYSHRPRYRFN
jgi:hypothetical protein